MRTRSEPTDRPTDGLKWTFYGEDVLGMWVAEMDDGLAPVVADALKDAVDRGITAYPYPILESAMVDAAVGFWADRFGWKVDAGSVVHAPDVVTGIRRAIMVLTPPGAPVVIHSPVYYPFYRMVHDAGRTVIEVASHLDESGRYRLDLDGIGRAFDDGARSIALCNPWNPTGRVFGEDELGDVIELARKHGALVISDEIHAPIVYPGARHIPAASLAPDTVVTVTAASKAWNIPGLKSAQVVLTADGHLERWGEAFTEYTAGHGTLGLVASAAAYRDGTAWFDETLERLERCRDHLVDLIGSELPGAHLVAPEGTYLAWIDLSAFGVDDPADRLLEEARVAVAAGGPFGSGCDRFIRFNFATTTAWLEESVMRIADVLVSR